MLGRLKEPFNGLSHLAGAILALIGLAALIVVSRGKPWHLTAFLIYGVTLIALYLASAIYHLHPHCPHRTPKLLLLDQTAIYLLIAGTYTPICLIALRGPVGATLLGVVWALALGGIALKIAWRSGPEWPGFVLYLVMGWLCLAAMRPLVRALPGEGIGWLAAGGVLYTVGAAVFASGRPRLWPGRFGSHELWHVFVLAGSACHFMVMFLFVAAHP